MLVVVEAPRDREVSIHDAQQLDRVGDRVHGDPNVGDDLDLPERQLSLGAITSHRFDTKSYGSKGGRRLTLPHRTHAVERLKAHTTNPQRTCRGAHAHAHAQVRG